MGLRNAFLHPWKGFASRTRCALVCLIIWQLLTGGISLGDDTTSHTGVLKTLRAGRHGIYTSVVFEFGSPCLFDKPIPRGDQIFLKLQNVTTDLPAYREYNYSDVWVKLEKSGNDVKAWIGLPKHFSKFRYFTMQDPDRLVINFYRSESQDTFSTAKIPSGIDEDEPLPHRPIKGLSSGVSPERTYFKISGSTVQEEGTDETSSVQSPLEEKSSGVVVPVGNERLLTLNFHQGDIHEILSALAIQQNLNIVTAPDIGGKVSVHLFQMPTEIALEAITRAGGCTFHRRGEVYYVYKPKEEIEPGAERLKMRIYKLKYADAEKVQEILQAIPGTRMIRIHEPSRTIIVEDIQENIDKIETVLRYWDVKPKQVMIETKILEISLTDEMSLGVNWEQMLGDVIIGTGGFSTGTIPSVPGTSPVPGEGAGVFANVITGAGTRHQFTAALDALQTKTTINTLSTPKIMAMHSKAAKVQVGGQQGYKVTTVSDGIATEDIQFIDTGTILEITPYIDDNGNILLNVKPSIETARIEEGLPVVTTTEVTTSLVAKSGETVFIGGLIQNTRAETQERIPCLGGIPGLGWLFGRTSEGIGKSELVVLITPQIVEDRMSMNKEVIEKAKEMEKSFSE